MYCKKFTCTCELFVPTWEFFGRGKSRPIWSIQKVIYVLRLSSKISSWFTMFLSLQNNSKTSLIVISKQAFQLLLFTLCVIKGLVLCFCYLVGLALSCQGKYTSVSQVGKFLHTGSKIHGNLKINKTPSKTFLSCSHFRFRTFIYCPNLVIKSIRKMLQFSSEFIHFFKEI